MIKIARYSLLTVFLIPLVCAVAWAGTILTESTIWCTQVIVPNAGEPVSVMGGTGSGTIRRSIQCLTDRTNGIIRGTVAHAYIDVGLVAGAPVTPTGGQIDAFGNINSVAGKVTALGNVEAGQNLVGQVLDLSSGPYQATASPTGTITEGQQTRDGVIFARGIVSGAGGCIRCVNVASASRAGLGHYVVTLPNIPTYAAGVMVGNGFNATLIATPIHGTAVVYEVTSYVSVAAGPVAQIDLYVFDSANAPVDTAVSFVMYP